MDYFHKQNKPIYVAEELDRITKKVWGDRKPFEIHRTETGVGPNPTTEMSDYFDYAQYDRATRVHPFYQEMLEGMIASIHQKAGLPRRYLSILEIGCGNGSFTDELMKLERVNILATDIDWKAIKYLQRRLRAGSETVWRFLKLERADALAFRTKEPVDVVAASWNYEHITDYENGSALAKAVAVNLKDDGVYVEGAELVGPFGDEQERQHAFVDYHEDIIDRALAVGHQDTAEIEWGAMVSGITGVSHHKRDVLTHIRELERGGLKLVCWKKYGPFTERVGAAGVYSFAFSKASSDDSYPYKLLDEFAGEVRKVMAEIASDHDTHLARFNRNHSMLADIFRRWLREDKKK